MKEERMDFIVEGDVPQSIENLLKFTDEEYWDIYRPDKYRFAYNLFHELNFIHPSDEWMKEAAYYIFSHLYELYDLQTEIMNAHYNH